MAYGQGTVIKDHFFSHALDTMRAVDVYLPKGYDPTDSTKHYPVIYFLHGSGTDQTLYSVLFAILLDRHIGGRAIAPVIFVLPDGSAPPYKGSFYTNSALYGRFEDYIVKDLIDYIETNYNVRRARDTRFIMGVSMGGYGAMKLAIKHPDIYRGVVSHSGPLDLNQVRDLLPRVLSENGSAAPYSYSPDAGSFTALAFTMAGAFTPNLSKAPYFVDFILDGNGNIIDSVFSKWLLHNPARLANQASSISPLAIYFDCGRQDELNVFQFNTAFADSLQRAGLNFVFQPFDGGHFNKLMSRIEVSLAFIDSVMKSFVSTEVDDEAQNLPRAFALYQNYPNPFNPSTTIEFSLRRSAEVTLKVYNTRGQEVATLVSEKLPPGNFRYEWNASGLAAGVYYYRLRAGSMVETRKLVLLK
jgi:S-formylglutathione hydrolase FrmB